jgi:predicted nucleotidyltransferase
MLDSIATRTRQRSRIRNRRGCERVITVLVGCYPCVVISDAQIARIETILNLVGGLDALWIFGSEATGTSRPTSDVDIAALFASRPSQEALFASRAEIETLLGRVVDLVDLDAASPILAMQVLRHGQLVRQGNSAHRIRFTATLPGRYEDVVLLRRPAEKLLQRRLALGRP